MFPCSSQGHLGATPEDQYGTTQVRPGGGRWALRSIQATLGPKAESSQSGAAAWKSLRAPRKGQGPAGKSQRLPIHRAALRVGLPAA